MPGSPSHVLAGRAHVDVAEKPLAKHVAELVLDLSEALMGSNAKPLRRLEHVYS